MNNAAAMEQMIAATVTRGAIRPTTRSVAWGRPRFVGAVSLPLRARNSRVAGTKEEHHGGTRRFVSPEAALWTAVYEQILMDIKRGLKALRSRDASTPEAVDNRGRLLAEGARAASWLLNARRARGMLLDMLGIEDRWLTPLVIGHFGRANLERLAALKPLSTREAAAVPAVGDGA
jgi:hypothetical protein